MLLRFLYKLRWIIPFLAVGIATFCILYFDLKPQEKFALASAIFAGAALFYTFILIEGNERTFTYYILADWYKSDLNKHHVNIFYFTSDNDITDVTQRFIDGKLTPQDEEKFQKIAAILNYLQILATFYFDNKIDRSVIKENFRHIVMKYYKKFEKLIKYNDSQHPNDTLSAFVRLHNEFRKS